MLSSVFCFYIYPFKPNGILFPEGFSAPVRNPARLAVKKYRKRCYLRRDEYMVRKADTVIAYWDLVPKGGTFYTVNKALESGKSVINASPPFGQAGTDGP